jgi:hypothetical protein
MVCFNGFKHGTPLLVIVIILNSKRYLTRISSLPSGVKEKRVDVAPKDVLVAGRSIEAIKE